MDDEDQEKPTVSKNKSRKAIKPVIKPKQPVVPFKVSNPEAEETTKETKNGVKREEIKMKEVDPNIKPVEDDEPLVIKPEVKESTFDNGTYRANITLERQEPGNGREPETI